MMIFQLLFVIFIMPETKGISIESLFKKISLNNKQTKSTK